MNHLRLNQIDQNKKLPGSLSVGDGGKNVVRRVTVRGVFSLSMGVVGSGHKAIILRSLDDEDDDDDDDEEEDDDDEDDEILLLKLKLICR